MNLVSRKLLLPGLHLKVHVWCIFSPVAVLDKFAPACGVLIHLCFPPSLGQLASRCPKRERAGFLTTAFHQLLEDLSLMHGGSLSCTLPASGTLGIIFQASCLATETGEWLSPVSSVGNVLLNGLTVSHNHHPHRWQELWKASTPP